MGLLTCFQQTNSYTNRLVCKYRHPRATGTIIRIIRGFNRYIIAGNNLNIIGNLGTGCVVSPVNRNRRRNVQRPRLLGFTATSRACCRVRASKVKASTIPPSKATFQCLHRGWTVINVPQLRRSISQHIWRLAQLISIFVYHCACCNCICQRYIGAGCTGQNIHCPRCSNVPFEL